MRDSFTFYRSFYEATRDLPRDIQGEVYTAIMEYGLNGITTENLKPVSRSIFILIKPVIEANNQRFKNGMNGGRPKKSETEPKPNPNQAETKPEPEKEKEKEKDNNTESSNEDSSSGGLPPDPASSPASIDYKKLIGWYNEKTKGVFGALKYPLGETRKKLLRARIAEHGKESFVKVVENAINSDFLRGQTGFKTTFDWLIKPSNYEKVLSENYKNLQNATSQRNCTAGRQRPTPGELSAAVKIGIALANAGKNG